MALLGLIGFPVSHSFSPAYFEKRFIEAGMLNWTYKLFPITDLADLEKLIISEPELQGFNVTIPHKQGVLNYCNELSKEVKETGAANCVKISRIENNISLKAFNTDFSAFKACLIETGRSFKKAIVMGNGGSSQAVQYALKLLNIPFDVASRSSGISYNEIQTAEYDLFINCTPVGMFSPFETGISGLLELDYERINSGVYYFDLVYNPAITPMLQKFEAKGASTQNGLKMLHLQADLAWEIFM